MDVTLLNLNKCSRLGRPKAVHADGVTETRRAGGGRERLLRGARRHGRAGGRRPRAAGRGRARRAQP